MIEFLKESFQKLLKFLNTLCVKFINKKNTYRIQTFTYYIPAPPPRKTGYREKEFDKIFYAFINAGFEIISFHTEPHIGPQSSGLWIVAIVRATKDKTDPLDLDFQGESPLKGPDDKDDVKSMQQDLHYYDDGPELSFSSLTSLSKDKNLFEP